MLNIDLSKNKRQNLQDFLISTILILIACSLGGCATGVWNLPAYSELPPEKSGLVVASVGRANNFWAKGAVYRIGFRPVSEPRSVGEFRFAYSWFASVDIERGELRANVLQRRLPPGEYEIYSASVSLPQLMMYYDKRSFSFKFRVEANKATYLGEFLGFPVSGKNIVGIDTTAGFYFTVRDEMERDIAIVRRREPDLRLENIIRAVMSRSETANSNFVSAQ